MQKEQRDLTLPELAMITRRHPESLRRLARAGRVPGMYRLGRRWLIAAESAARLRGLKGDADER